MYSYIQPKFKDCVFDSSKEPEAVRVWLRLISGLVMSIGNGVCQWLETFLDSFLGRNPFQSSTRPAFLNDPALALADSPEGNATFPSPMPPTSESGGNSPLPSFDRATMQSRDGTETINPKQYRELPEEAMSLDKDLFSIITTIVKGSYLFLWRHQLESSVGLNSHSKTRAGQPVFGPAYSPARPRALPMPLLSSGPIAIGAVVIIRTVLLDTLR